MTAEHRDDLLDAFLSHYSETTTRDEADKYIGGLRDLIGRPRSAQIEELT